MSHVRPPCALVAARAAVGPETLAQACDHLGQVANWEANPCQERDAAVDGISRSDQFLPPVVWRPACLTVRDTAREAAPVIEFFGVGRLASSTPSALTETAMSCTSSQSSCRVG